MSRNSVIQHTGPKSSGPSRGSTESCSTELSTEPSTKPTSVEMDIYTVSIISEGIHRSHLSSHSTPDLHFCSLFKLAIPHIILHHHYGQDCPSRWFRRRRLRDYRCPSRNQEARDRDSVAERGSPFSPRVVPQTKIPQAKPKRDVPEGATLVAVDYSDSKQLVQILNGVHTVLSFVAEMEDPTSPIQRRLIDASVKAGVKRFAPSEWAS